MGFDLLQLLECAVDVDRVDLVRGNTIGEQRGFECGQGVIAKRARSRELLHIPEVGP
jgi:hypothetical protein